MRWPSFRTLQTWDVFESPNTKGTTGGVHQLLPPNTGGGARPCLIVIGPRHHPLVRAFVHETLKDSHSYSYSYDSYSVAAGQPCRLWLVKARLWLVDSQAMSLVFLPLLLLLPPLLPLSEEKFLNRAVDAGELRAF